MKQLFLFRHARAGKLSLGTADFERKLSSKGNLDALKMAHRMRLLGNIPELMISSPANRTVETAQILAAELGYPLPKIILEPLLYSDDEKALRSLLKTIDDKYTSVMLVGHNPLLSEIAGYFTGNYEIKLVPASCCCVEFNKNNWKKISKAQGEMKLFDFPDNKTQKNYLSHQVRKNLTELIRTEIKNELAGIDIPAYEATEKLLNHSIRKVVKKFVKSLKIDKLTGISPTKIRAESPSASDAESVDPEKTNPDNQQPN